MCPLVRDRRVLVGWPLPLGFGVDGRLLLARRGQVCIEFTMIMYNKPAHAVPLASASQHPENQKENRAGHSSERTVEGHQVFRCDISMLEERCLRPLGLLSQRRPH